VFIRALHWYLSWVRWIQFILPHPISLRYILILSSHLCVHLPQRSGQFYYLTLKLSFNIGLLNICIRTERLMGSHFVKWLIDFNCTPLFSRCYRKYSCFHTTSDIYLFKLTSSCREYLLCDVMESILPFVCLLRFLFVAFSKCNRRLKVSLNQASLLKNLTNE
jgi:hypothetical protein